MEEIEAKLTALQNSLSGAQMKSKLASIGEKVRLRIELSFERERSPFGQAWAPLSANTAIAYMRKSGTRGGARARNRVFLAKFGAGGSKKILRLSGNLADRWNVEASETSVTIKKEPYARWLVNEEEKLEDAAKMVITKLRECGYHLSLLWKESQFVDFGLVIDWSKAGKQS